MIDRHRPGSSPPTPKPCAPVTTRLASDTGANGRGIDAVVPEGRRRLQTGGRGGDKARAALDAAQQQLAVIETQKQQTRAALDAAIADRDTAG